MELNTNTMGTPGYDELQKLVNAAWEATTTKERLELAKKAIAILPDCVDAYIIFAQEACTSNSLQQAKEYYTKAVTVAENTIGNKNYADCSGEFGEMPVARPYMRALLGLADVLWQLGEKKDAMDKCKLMLTLSPKDEQGARFTLINWLMEERLYEDIDKLFQQYKDDGSASFLYSRALYLFWNDNIVDAGENLKAAISHNQYVPFYILGYKVIPEHLPEYMSIGDENEAIAYAYDSMHIWHKTENACDWLKINFASLL